MSFRSVLIAAELCIMARIADPKHNADSGEKYGGDPAASCLSHTKQQAAIIWSAMHEARVWLGLGGGKSFLHTLYIPLVIIYRKCPPGCV